MKILKRALPLLGLVGTLALACSSESGEGGGGGGTGHYTDRYCALLQPCCEAVGVQSEMQACKLAFKFPAPADAAAAEDCMAEYEARGQDANWCATFSSAPRPASCERAFPSSGGNGNTGTALPGESCSRSADCAPSAKGPVSCTDDFGDSTNYCQVRVDVKAGEACFGTRDGNSTTVSNPPRMTAELFVCNRSAGPDASNCEGGVACRSLGRARRARALPAARMKRPIATVRAKHGFRPDQAAPPAATPATARATASFLPTFASRGSLMVKRATQTPTASAATATAAPAVPRQALEVSRCYCCVSR